MKRKRAETEIADTESMPGTKTTKMPTSTASTSDLLHEDSGRAWLVVMATFTIHLVTHGLIFSFGILFLPLEERFRGASKGEIAWVGSLMTGTMYLGGPLAGHLSARFGYRPVAVTGAMVAFLGYILSLAVPELHFLYLTMGVITGLGFSFLYQPAVVAVTQAFRKYRTIACGLSSCGAGIGAFIFSPLQKWLLDTFSWYGTIMINAAIILNCIPCGLVLCSFNSSITSDVNKSDVSINDKSRKNRDIKEIKVDACEKPLLKDKLDTEQAYFTNISDLEVRIVPNVSYNQIKDVVIVEDDTKHHTKLLLQDVNKTGQEHLSNIHDSDVNSNGMKPVKVEYDVDEPYICNGDQLHNVCIDYQTDKHHGTDETHAPRRTANNKCLRFVRQCNIDVFRKPEFLLYVVSQFMFFLGQYIPFIYTPVRLKAIGIPETTSVWVISTIGISSISGRVILGYFADRVSLNRSRMFAAVLFIGGVITTFANYYYSIPLLYLYAAVFGICLGTGVTLISVVLVDLIGMECLNEAFGMSNLFTGLGTLLGPPLAGFLFDRSMSYSATFMTAGVAFIIGSVCLFFAPVFRRRRM